MAMAISWWLPGSCKVPLRFLPLPTLQRQICHPRQMNQSSSLEDSISHTFLAWKLVLTKPLRHHAKLGRVLVTSSFRISDLSVLFWGDAIPAMFIYFYVSSVL
jgi:hypothetical protein